MRGPVWKCLSRCLSGADLGSRGKKSANVPNEPEHTSQNRFVWVAASDIIQTFKSDARDRAISEDLDERFRYRHNLPPDYPVSRFDRTREIHDSDPRPPVIYPDDD